MNLLHRLSLARLLLLCGSVLLFGISVTALALALGSGPTPPPEPLPEAIHDALIATPVEGVSAQIQLTDHLLEGADLASGGEAGQLSSSPLLSGASGRLWISKVGHVRLELQSEKGDTQILYDGHTVQMYDASSNTLYRYTPPRQSTDESSGLDTKGSVKLEYASKPDAPHEAPSVTKIEEAVSHLSKHANLSGATPTDIAGQAAYTVHISPKETGSLLGGVELSWDAVHGVPLRAAIYSSTSPSSPAIELAATSISYGPVEASVLEFTPPTDAKIEEVILPNSHGSEYDDSAHGDEHTKLTSQGHGLSTIGISESQAKPGTSSSSAPPEGLPQVKVNGTAATELATELGTLLTFERSGVRYLVAGAVAPSTVEAAAKGL
jgi:outer membrane lipoprotein-sorting protein